MKYERNGHLTDIGGLAPAFAGILDANEIGVAGLSEGTTAVLANVGAWQQCKPGGPHYQEHNDAPIACLATDIQCPMYASLHAGFQSPGTHR